MFSGQGKLIKVDKEVIFLLVVVILQVVTEVIFLLVVVILPGVISSKAQDKALVGDTGVVILLMEEPLEVIFNKELVIYNKEVNNGVLWSNKQPNKEDNKELVIYNKEANNGVLWSNKQPNKEDNKELLRFNKEPKANKEALRSSKEVNQ